MVTVDLALPMSSELSLRSELLNGWANRDGISKSPKSHAEKVSRQSKVSLRSEVLDGGVHRAMLSRLRPQAKVTLGGV